jgi:predicted lactoylglutathione lyase
MIKSIFLNMPVANVAKSREFFAGLGFSFNEQFSGEDSVCLIIGPNNQAMLSNKAKFGSFIDKPIADKSVNEVIISLECESAQIVTSLSEKAFALGARRVNDPEDQGFMFSWGFEDLDGHLWDLFWFNPEHKG